MDLKKEKLQMLKDERNGLQSWINEVKEMIYKREEKIKLLDSIIKQM